MEDKSKLEREGGRLNLKTATQSVTIWVLTYANKLNTGSYVSIPMQECMCEMLYIFFTVQVLLSEHITFLNIKFFSQVVKPWEKENNAIN